MFEAIKTLDTPLEWAESIVAVISLFVGLIIGNWASSKIYELILGAIGLLLIALPILLIANGDFSIWQDIIIGSLGIGLIASFLLFPLTAIYRINERVKVLEKIKNV